MDTYGGSRYIKSGQDLADDVLAQTFLTSWAGQSPESKMAMSRIARPSYDSSAAQFFRKEFLLQPPARFVQKPAI